SLCLNKTLWHPPRSPRRDALFSLWFDPISGSQAAWRLSDYSLKSKYYSVTGEPQSAALTHINKVKQQLCLQQSLLMGPQRAAAGAAAGAAHLTSVFHPNTD
ncbi:uncharacterized protein V6R79_016423, partial [Siganus canaliculatus]